MGSALLFIVGSRLLVYSAGSGVNRVQVVLSGFGKRLFCFVQAKTISGSYLSLKNCVHISIFHEVRVLLLLLNMDVRNIYFVEIVSQSLSSENTHK